MEGMKEKEPFLKEDDPLFGVLKEDQVGRDSQTGRMRIAKDVLDGMRVYLMTSSCPDRIIKEERVKTSVQAILNDPTRQKSSLTLEPIPVITTDLDKGKGIVFGYENSGEGKQEESKGDNEGKLLMNAIDSGKRMNQDLNSGLELTILGPPNQFYDSPTDYRTGSSDAGSSGKSVRRDKPRKHPHMNRRKPRGLEVIEHAGSTRDSMDDTKETEVKRKAKGEVEGVVHETQRLKTMVVPKEGLSSLQ